MVPFFAEESHENEFPFLVGPVEGHVGVGKADFVTRKNKPQT